MRYYLSIDIGASSGRHILSHVEDGKLVLEEVFRFENGMEEKDGHLIWDYKKLFKNIVEGMKECKKLGVNIMDRVMATCILNENGTELGKIEKGRFRINLQDAGHGIFLTDPNGNIYKFNLIEE